MMRHFQDVPKGPVVQAPAAHTPKQFIAAAFEQAARNGDPGAQWSYAHCLQAGDEYTQADNVMVLCRTCVFREIFVLFKFRPTILLFTVQYHNIITASLPEQTLSSPTQSLHLFT